MGIPHGGLLLMPAFNFFSPGCCCSAGPGCTGVITFNVTVCGNPACMATVTITQTSGGSYTATMSGSSPFMFASVPCGNYSYSISAPGATTHTGTTTVSSTSSPTISYTFTTPSGYSCGCCPCSWFPNTLYCSTSLGTITCTYFGGSLGWIGSLVISYPGYNYSTGCVATTLSITLGATINCSGYSGGNTTFTASVGWQINGGSGGFPPPNLTICCPTPGMACPQPQWQSCSGVGGGYAVTATQSCSSPVNFSGAYTPCPCCDLPIGSITVTE